MKRSTLALLLCAPLLMAAVWFVTGALLRPGPPALGGVVQVSAPAGSTGSSPPTGSTSAADRLTETGRAFAADALDGHPAVPALRPSLVTDYFRATLLDHAAGSRMTIDTGLRFAGPHRMIPGSARHGGDRDQVGRPARFR